MAFGVTFGELLVLSTLALTGAFLVPLRRAEDAGSRFSVRTLSLVHGILLAVLVALTALAAHAGTRPLSYFVVLALLLASSVCLARRDTPRTRGLLFLTVLVVAFSIPVAIYVGNRFYPGGWENEPIFTTGSLEAYQVGAAQANVYYYIPVVTLLGAGIGFATGQALLISMLLAGTYLAGIGAAVLILFRRAHGGLVAGTLGVFLFLAAPPLSIFGRSGVLAHALLVVYFALAMYRTPRAAAVGALITGTVTIFAHPVGLAYILGTLLPVAVLGIRNWPLPGRSGQRLRGMILTLLVIAFAYWAFTYLLALGVRQGKSFYETIAAYFAGSAEAGAEGYVPRYAQSGFEVYALAWALPVAMAAAFFLRKLPAWVRRTGSPLEALAVSSALVGPAIVFLAYLAYPRGESGQYLIPVGYAIVLLAASVGTGATLLRAKGAPAAVALALVVPIAVVGFHSPDWAPIEHPDFATAARILPYRDYLEAQTARGFLPSGATVYYEFDFPIGGGLYKPVRAVVEAVYAGEDPARFAGSGPTFFGLRAEPFSNLPPWEWDVIYASGEHVVAFIESA